MKTSAQMYDELFQQLVTLQAAARAQPSNISIQNQIRELTAFLQNGDSTVLSADTAETVNRVVQGTPYQKNPGQIVAEVKSTSSPGNDPVANAQARAAALQTGPDTPNNTALPGRPMGAPGSGQGRQAPAAINAAAPGAVTAKSVLQTGDPNAPGSEPGSVTNPTAPNASAAVAAAVQRAQAAAAAAGNQGGTGAPTASAPTVTPPPTLPTAGKGGVPYGNLDTAALDQIIGKNADPNMLTDVALTGLGLDTGAPQGLRGEMLESGIAPYAKMAIYLRGLGLGNGEEMNPTQGALDNISGKLQEYGTAGKNFYGNRQQEILQLLGGANDSILNDNETPDVMNMLGNMQGAALGGANPMVRNALANRLRREMTEYRRATMNGGEKRTVMDYLRQTGILQQLFPGMK